MSSERKSLTLSDKLAVFALLLAVLSVVVSVWTACEQRRQWRATALARVVVVDIGFVTWRVLSLEKARSTDWGFQVLLSEEMNEGTVTGGYGVMTRPVARLRSDGQVVAGVAGITVPEILSELQGRGIGRSAVDLQQHLRIRLAFENIGQSFAKALRAEILGFLPDESRWTSLGPSQALDLGPGRRVFGVANVYMPLESALPSRLKVRVRLSWTTEDGSRVTTEQPLRYDKEAALWSFGE